MTIFFLWKLVRIHLNTYISHSTNFRYSVLLRLAGEGDFEHNLYIVYLYIVYLYIVYLYIVLLCCSGTVKHIGLDKIKRHHSEVKHCVYLLPRLISAILKIFRIFSEVEEITIQWITLFTFRQPAPDGETKATLWAVSQRVYSPLFQSLLWNIGLGPISHGT